MSSERREYAILDVFTSTPLEGNALAVFPDGSGLDERLMQRAARELNLSETVFVLPGDGDSDARLRIFTPAAEVRFAGHPVLGTAFLLAERSDAESVCLGTGSGLITVELQRDGEGISYGEMVAPMPTVSPFERPRELLDALGVSSATLPVELYNNGLRHVCVALADKTVVARLAPNANQLVRLGEICVSCFAADGDRCKTRMFAPALGVVEDPATGSAAGPIALHLARHGQIAFGVKLTISQGEELGRPSTLHAQVDGDQRRCDRIAVGGSAVLVARGSYRLR
jgi:trans-2,3-dihydro-3-hydroxyanthranilate isomerase